MSPLVSPVAPLPGDQRDGTGHPPIGVSACPWSRAARKLAPERLRPTPHLPSSLPTATIVYVPSLKELEIMTQYRDPWRSPPNHLESNERSSIENPEGAYRRAYVQAYQHVIRDIKSGATIYDLQRHVNDKLFPWRLRGDPDRANYPPTIG
jgi:hypothetical protein